LFEALPAGLQWVVAELQQQQQQQHSSAWSTCIHTIGMALITACSGCLALYSYGMQGHELVLPAAQLAVLLLQAEQQATEAAGENSSSSSCPAGGSDSSIASRWAPASHTSSMWMVCQVQCLSFLLLLRLLCTHG
jgi:hypothetical protein